MHTAVYRAGGAAGRRSAATAWQDAALYDADMLIGLGEGRVAEFDVVGDGAPLLWFEGGPGLNASLGRTDAEALPAGRFAGYLIEPAGSGRSTPPPDPRGYGFRQQARFYEDVRRALGLGPVTLFGHSWGGSVALAFAALFPEATARCMAMDAFAGLAVAGSPEGKREFAAHTRRFASRPWFPAAMRAFEAPAAQLPDHPARTGAFWAPMWPLQPDCPISIWSDVRCSCRMRRNSSTVRQIGRSRSPATTPPTSADAPPPSHRPLRPTLANQEPLPRTTVQALAGTHRHHPTQSVQINNILRH